MSPPPEERWAVEALVVCSKQSRRARTWKLKSDVKGTSTLVESQSRPTAARLHNHWPDCDKDFHRTAQPYQLPPVGNTRAFPQQRIISLWALSILSIFCVRGSSRLRLITAQSNRCAILVEAMAG